MKSISKFCALIAKEHPVYTIIILIILLLSGILPSINVILQRYIFDRAIPVYKGTIGFSVILFPIIGYICINLLQGFLGYVKRIITTYEADLVKKTLLEKLYEKSKRLRLESFENPELYNILLRAQRSVDNMGFMRFMMLLISIPGSIFVILSLYVTLVSFSWYLLLIGVLTAMPSVIARFIRGKRFYEMQVLRTPKERYLSYFTSLLTGRNEAKEIKAFQLRDYLLSKWQKTQKELLDEKWNFEKKQAKPQLIVDLTRYLGYGIGVIIAIWLVTVNAVSAGTFAAAIMALRTLQDNVTSILVTAGEMAERSLFISDIFRYLDIKEEEKRGGIKFDGIKDSIKVDNISFVYHGSDKPVIKNVSFEIRKGEKIALVGLNGAGKTTLVKLLLGLYRPQKGRILYDGKDIEEYDPGSIREKVSVVFQDYIKYQLSVRENIGFGAIQYLYDEDKIKEAAYKGGAKDIIDDLPHGLDTVLGRTFPDSTDLSGGEWQKIAASRGFMRNPELLVLDEPTASLDPISESRIFERYTKMARGITTILVSHRIGFARLADRILVLKDGRLVEEGTYAELLDLKGEYYRLFSVQAQWYKDEMGDEVAKNVS